MANLPELWQSAENLLAQDEYEQAIAILVEIQNFSSQLRPEKLIQLKKSFIIDQEYCGDVFHRSSRICYRLIKLKLSLFTGLAIAH